MLWSLPLLLILAVDGTPLSCEKRLDVISAEKWPILQSCPRGELDKAVFVDVGLDYFGTRAVVYTSDNVTYLHGVAPYYTVSGSETIRELAEIRGYSVKDIQFGSAFIVILTEDGSVWTAGKNTFGQLSRDTVNRPVFTKVQDLPPVLQMAAGGSHCVVLTQDARLFSWGDGGYGGLGQIDYSPTSNPIPQHFGLGQDEASPSSICCTGVSCVALTKSSSPLTWGSSLYIGRSGDFRVPGPVSGIPSEETIIKVSCGSRHVVAVSTSGKLYGWGWNSFGELLQAPEYTKQATALNLDGKIVRDVVAGSFVTIIRTDPDDVYYFGIHGDSHYSSPQLADGSHPPRDVMAQGYFGQDSRGAVRLGCHGNTV